MATKWYLAEGTEKQLMESVTKDIKSKGYVTPERWGMFLTDGATRGYSCGYHVGILKPEQMVHRNTAKGLVHKLLRIEREPPTILWFSPPEAATNNWVMEIPPSSRNAKDIIRLANELEDKYKVNIKIRLAGQASIHTADDPLLL